MRGKILKGIGGFYYALDDDGNVHLLRAQAKIRHVKLKPMVGDNVEFIPGMGEDEGWLTQILPRANQLTRPPVANIGLMLLVIAAKAPDPDLDMADRLMIAAIQSDIPVKLIVNKCDLDELAANAILRQYAKANVQPVKVSARTHEGILQLRDELAGKVCALAGQSGAGKSSLINALYGLTLKTGDVSHKIERGKHTTRHCELIPVTGGGMVLDTPGFSLLDAELMEPMRLKDYYPEFAPYEGGCYFNPCTHVSEPVCAVKEAVQAGDIDLARHARYARLYEDMRVRWRDRYE